MNNMRRSTALGGKSFPKRATRRKTLMFHYKPTLATFDCEKCTAELLERFINNMSMESCLSFDTIEFSV